jgi:hypothetical protein
MKDFPGGEGIAASLAGTFIIARTAPPALTLRQQV